MTDPRPAPRGAATLIAAIILALLLAWFAGPAQAQAVDPFTVEDVPIDATAADTAQARRKAIAVGQAKAFSLLLRRLAHSKEFARLPKAPPAAELVNLIAGISVRQEKSSKVRYLALLTVRFKPERIRTILKIASINFVDTPSRPIVVLPLYRFGDKLVLWEDPNPWRAAWNKVPLKGGLVSFVLALGDLADVQSVSAERGLMRNKQALSDFAGRYGAGEVLIALAEETGGSTEHPKLKVTLWRFDTLTKRMVRAGRRRAVSASDRKRTFIATATAVARAIERQWKAENQAVIGGEPRDLRVRVPIESLGQWTEIRERVKRVRVVKGTRVLRLSRERAILMISFVGDIKRLRQGLAQQNVELVALPGAEGGSGNGGGSSASTGGSTGGSTGNGSGTGGSTDGGTNGGSTVQGAGSGEPMYELRLGGGVSTGNGSTAPKSKSDP